MKRMRDERGTVIVTAVMMLMVMVALGLAVLSQVDTQTTQSRKERERESSFNLAEAALSAQTFVLGRRGTGTATIPYPASCSLAASSHFYCPASAQLMRSYNGSNGSGQVDFDSATTWTDMGSRRREPDDRGARALLGRRLSDQRELGSLRQGRGIRRERRIDPEPPRVGACGGHREAARRVL